MDQNRKAGGTQTVYPKRVQNTLKLGSTKIQGLFLHYPQRTRETYALFSKKTAKNQEKQKSQDSNGAKKTYHNPILNHETQI